MENFRIFENGDGVASREGDKVGRLDEKMFRVAKVNRRRRLALSFCVFFFNQRKFKPRSSIISSIWIEPAGVYILLSQSPLTLGPIYESPKNARGECFAPRLF